MTSATQAGRTTVKVTKGTVITPSTAVVVNTAPSLGGRYSIHDCADPSQAGLHNCVWPINLASPDGVTFNHGITIHTPGEQTGNFTIVYT